MKLKHKIGIWLLIVSLGLFLGYQRITTFPTNVHAWAEGGQYSIALGFLDNGFDFFHPETFVLNPQFPGKQSPITESGITAVDFPVFQYFTAGIMKITGNTSPVIYRLLVFLYSCLGLYFLFQLTFLLTKSFVKGLFVLLFVLLSPLFVYYQTGMLVSMPAISTAFIAFYFLIQFFKNQSYKSYLWAIGLITLAAAIRTTYLISFGAIGLWFLVEAIQQKKIKLSVFIPLLVGLLFIIAYRYYNFTLTQTYGSIFLNQFLMAEDSKEFMLFMNRTWESWSLDYYSISHYFILGLILKFGSLIYLNRSSHIPMVKRKLFFIAVAGLLASVVFLVCMSQQFPQHDYYFLDTFFLPITLLLISGLSLVPPLRGYYWKYVLILILFFPAGMHAYEVQQKRTDNRYWNELTSTVSSLKGVDKVLDCLGFKLDAKVLIAGVHGSNLPLILTKRKGYTLLRNSKSVIQEAFEWDYDCILLPQNLFLTKIYPNYPDIIHELKRIGGNEKLGVFVKQKQPNQSLEEFLGLVDSKVIAEIKSDFETRLSENWRNVNRTGSNPFSGRYSAEITAEEEYGLSIDLDEVETNGAEHSIYFNAIALSENLKSMDFVMVIEIDGRLLHYEAKNIGALMKEVKNWTSIKLLYEVPEFKNKKIDIKFYLWNNGRGSLFLDDISLSLIENKKVCQKENAKKEF